MSKNKIWLNYKEKFSVLLLFFAFLPNVFPMITLYISEVVVTNLCIVMWFIFVNIYEKSTVKLLSLKLLWPVLVLFVMVLFAYVAGAGVFGNRYLALSLLYWGCVIFKYYNNTNRLYVLKIVIVMLFPFLLYTLYKTTIMLMTNPWIARAIKSEGEATEAILRQGVGGYKYIYMLVLISAIVLYVFLNEKTVIRKVISLALYLCCFFTIIISNYFTALIAGFIMTVIMITIFFYTRKQFFPMMILVLISIFLLIWGEDVLESLINMFIRLAPDGRTASRLLEINNDISGGLVKEMQSDRLPTILKSLKTAFNYPLIGVILETNALTLLGQHSHIMDTLAIWGLFVGGINIGICFMPFKKNMFRGKGAVITVPVLVGYLIIIGFNNIANSVALISTIIYPYYYERYKK